MHRSTPILAIVVPCHNEIEVLAVTAERLSCLLEDMVTRGLASSKSYVCFVDDGSTDDTWRAVENLVSSSKRFHGIKLARNFGHQGAVLAGMFECTADAVATIDADLQDDERCIAEMVERYLTGDDVVFGVRDDRSTDSLFKRSTAQLYYRILRLVGVRVVFNHADYRLLSKRAVDQLREYSETNLFLRGIVPMIGLRSSMVRYARRARLAGESRYPLPKMLALAWEGITSFSVAPLRAVAALGASISLGSLGVTFWALYIRLFGEMAVPGWASTVVPMYFLGGVQILCLGVIGEYIGKMYLETKRRPRYAIDRHIGSASAVERG